MATPTARGTGPGPNLTGAATRARGTARTGPSAADHGSAAEGGSVGLRQDGDASHGGASPADAMLQTVELAESIRALSGKLARRLREQSTVGDYTPSQKNVIVRLDRDGSATLSALARAEGMKPQSMAAILAALDEASMVSSQPDPNDRRQHLWSITDQAREALLSGRAARTDWLARSIRDSLDAAEEAELRRGIELLTTVVDGRTG